MSDAIKIIAIDDDPGLLDRLKAVMNEPERGFEFYYVTAADDIFKVALSRNVDVILLNMNMLATPGMPILQALRDVLPDVPVIVLTSSGAPDLAVEAMKCGAFHYLTLPIRWDELPLYIDKAIAHRKLSIERRQLTMANIRYQAQLEETVAKRTAELRNALDGLRQAHIETIFAMASAIEAKDVYTQGHCRRVHGYAMALGKEASLPPEGLSALEYGTLLHDIGKIGIASAILNKPGRLDDDERAIIETHPGVGARIVEGIAFFAPALVVVRHHHERVDGKGYPDGLSGERLPVIARIAAIADAYDAMTSDRPYRKGMPTEEALRRLNENRDTQFDAALTDLFVEKKLYILTEDPLPSFTASVTPGVATPKRKSA